MARGRAGGSAEGVRELCRTAEERLEGCGAEGDAVAGVGAGEGRAVVVALVGLWARGLGSGGSET